MSEARKTAIVTGAGSGIGHAISAELLTLGFDVAMAGLQSQPVDGMPDAKGGAHARYYPFDLSDSDDQAGLLDKVARQFGPIHCLVNNAGVSSLERGDLLDMSMERFDRSVAINLRGTFFLTQAVARRMLQDRSGGNGLFRSIITIGSVNAEIVGENRGDYCMTKAALSMMSKLFASRLAADRIAVFEIRPGIIRTPMTAPAAGRYDRFIAEGGVPAQRWGEPRDVARAVATLADGHIPFATGIHIDVGGGMQLHRV